VAKGIANGLPLSATLCTAAIADSLKSLTISTFGGNPVSAAAANATLAVMEEQDLKENAARQGQRLREGLERIQRKHPRTIGEVRGKGLMQGVELVKDETASDRTPQPQATNALLEESRKRGLLIGKGGLYGNVLRIAPPLVVTAAEVDEALGALDESFTAIEAGGS